MMTRREGGLADKAISLVGAEWEALAGRPWLQFKLYVVLRWYMDARTGLVGAVRGISRQSLAEELYVEPARGRHTSESGSPTIKAIRSALDGLAAAGLLQPRRGGEAMVFLLPLAKRISARPNDEGPMRGRGEGPHEGPCSGLVPQGISHHEGPHEGPGSTRYEGPTSEVRVNPISVEATAAYCCPVDKLPTGGHGLLLVPSKIAEIIRHLECRRGKAVRVESSDARLAEWSRRGITEDQLGEAYDLAVIDRRVTRNPAPIHPGFLDLFVTRILSGRQASRKRDGAAARPWHLSPEGIEAKANQFGLARSAGESHEALRGRVESAMVKAEYEAWQEMRRK